jgi:osmotically-inducible protein OsmY
MALPIHFVFIIPLVACLVLSAEIASASALLEHIPDDDLPELNREHIDDARIMVAIKHQLARVGGKAFSSIEVSVQDGVATLRGTADSLWIQQRARELSQVIRGVRGVIDRMTVGPVESTTDAALKKYLEATFFDDPVVELKDIHLDVKRGRVTLEGRVKSWQEKHTAVNVAKMVKGVREVRDALVVQFVNGRSDSDIRKEVARRFDFDVWVERPTLLQVHVLKGKVSLRGQVGSLYEKIRAADLAWVEGVREVEASGIEVVRMSRDPMVRDHRPMPTDQEIAEAIRMVLGYDPRVSPFKIHVAVSNGSVTLQGQVPFLSIKREAEQDVKNTVGVLSVHNQLTVQGDSSLTDQIIRTRIQAIFSRHSVLEKFSLHVSVRKGTVLLVGTVNSMYERNLAENVASKLRGVESIQNHIVFSNKEEDKTDWEIQLDIENQIWWSTFLSEQDIVAIVQGGKATLTGSVEYDHQRLIAEQQAFEAGASVVMNRLRVGQSRKIPDSGGHDTTK